MIVKVYCPCGAKFEFEVEPVNGRMPMPLACPVCGADATGLANDVIRQQFAAAAPAPVTAPAPAPAPVAPAPSSGGLRINRAAPAPVAASAEAAPHAPAQRPVPQRAVPSAPAWERSMAKDQLNPAVKWSITSVVALLALAGAVWFWYVWFARDPKVVYSLDFPATPTPTGKAYYRGDAFYQLLGPNRLLAIKNKNVALMDCSQQISLWSVPVPAGAESYGSPDVIANTNNIWVVWPGQVLCVDAKTGAPKQLSLPDSVLHIIAGSNMVLVLSGASPTNETVTRFSVMDGSSQTETITLPPPKPETPVAPVAINRLPQQTTPDASERQARAERRERFERDREIAAGQNPAQSAGATVARVASVENSGHAPREQDVEEILSRLEEGNTPLFDAGANAVWFQSKLLEHREITRQAMKPDSGKSVLDNPNVTASQGLELAQEMANKSQRERTGGVDIIDISRYQVTLHRLFANGVADWTGEIVGPPHFIPLTTVDLVVAGTNLVAFDKNNKKLWDAKLTYPVSAYDDFGNDRPPCLETGDALYFADKGMLTRFDPATGNVRWRLTSVGISAVQIDDRGRLYLDTTTLRPETIQYSQQIDLREHDLRVIMQVDPATGNILWRSDFPGLSYECLCSGKFLYSTRVWQTQDMLKLEEGPDTHFTMKLLEPSNGKMVWNHVLNNKEIIKVQVRQNWILLQTADRVAVLKFFSL